MNQQAEKIAKVFREHIAEMDRMGLDNSEKYLLGYFLRGIAGDIGDIIESADVDREEFIRTCSL